MTFLRGARQLLTLAGPAPRRGTQHTELEILRDGALLIDGSTIIEVGSTRRIENLAAARKANVIDATGKVVLPAFVDCHTSPIFQPPGRAGVSSLAQELHGESPTSGFEHSARTATPRQLTHEAQRWMRLFAAHGSGTVEIKAPACASLPLALKGLRIARGLGGHPLDVISSFIPSARDRDLPSDDEAAAVEEVIIRILPAILRRGLVDFCDVDCGQNAFSVSGANAIIRASQRLGVATKLRLSDTPSGAALELCAAPGVRTVEATGALLPNQAESLAQSSALVTLLPMVNTDSAPPAAIAARALLDGGAALALASGFHPGRHPCLSMQTALAVAQQEASMSAAEAISAATINGAAAAGQAGTLGSLEPGKQADLAVFDVPDFRDIAFHAGVNLCILTMKRGRIIHPPGASQPE